eukprot:6514931-Prymnesium_polylepis.1
MFSTARCDQHGGRGCVCLCARGGYGGNGHAKRVEAIAAWRCGASLVCTGRALTFQVSVRDADAVQVDDAADEHRKARLQLWTAVGRSQLAKVAELHQIVE